MIDPFDNPNKNPSQPTNSRFGAQFRSLFQSAQPQFYDAVQQAKDWAANNPDKLESIGERAGQAAAIGLGGGLIGRKAGKKIGRKLGQAASKKAQGVQGSLPFTEDPGTQDLPF